MCIAKSGLRKGYPIKQAQKVVEALEVTKIISGRNSIQAIITELSKSWTLESGKILKNAQAMIVNDELDSLLIGDPQAQTILTALYDSFYHTKWINTLKKDGRETLNLPYVSMLTATNPEHLDNFLDKVSIKGGFLGRTQMVYEEKKSKINPLIEENDASRVDTKPITDMLGEISKIKGQISFTKDSVLFYKNWYRDFYGKLETGEITDDSGTAERAGDVVLKLAMIHAVDELSMVVSKQHIITSTELFYDSSRSTKRILAGTGTAENSNKVRIVLSYLLAKPDFAAYKRQILSAKYGDLDSASLNQIVETLEQAKIIEIIMDREEGPLYKITPTALKEIRGTKGS